MPLRPDETPAAATARLIAETDALQAAAHAATLRALEWERAHPFRPWVYALGGCAIGACCFAAGFLVVRLAP